MRCDLCPLCPPQGEYGDDVCPAARWCCVIEWMIKNSMKFSNLKWVYLNGKNVVYYEDYPHDIPAKPLYYEDGQPENIIGKWLYMECVF